MGETSELETKKVKRGWLKLVIAIVLLGFFFMAQIIITLVVGAKVEADPFVQTGIAEVCVAALSVLAMVALGGRKWLTVDAEGIRYAFRAA